jgi:hypothetical protein
VENRFDIVAVGVQQKRGEISGMVFPLTRCAIVAAASGEAGFMEALHGSLILRLESEVNVGTRALVRAQRIDPKLVDLQMLVVVTTDWLPKRAQYGAVEALGSGEVTRPQMHMIEQPSEM